MAGENRMKGIELPCFIQKQLQQNDSCKSMQKEKISFAITKLNEKSC